MQRHIIVTDENGKILFERWETKTVSKEMMILHLEKFKEKRGCKINKYFIFSNFEI